MEPTILELLNGAWGTLWVLLTFSVIVVALALERMIALWSFSTHARALSDTVNRCLMRGAVSEGRSACERSRSPLADVFLVGYERYGRSKPENVASAVHRERVRVVARLKSRSWVTGTVGATAPFVGLFGTVVGIMEAFRHLRDAEASGQEAGIGVVSGAISEALIATAAGIGVAVIAVILFNLFNQRIGRVSMELKMMTDEFLEGLYESEPERERVAGGTEPAKEGADGDREAA
ncbi:MotA/TolQ/ExbB proton channel family protein [Haliangium sp.]|uniref:MotA/TolQ/ExbB proton channel family protein n=1 Tax=Haliangium sp. TaxID=2663208 RepID=UPI003D0F370C